MENKTPFREVYQSALNRYLRRGSKISTAHSVGTQAVAAGLELLEMARIHENSLKLETSKIPQTKLALLNQMASLFFAEAITPIEKTHRGARESAEELNRLNQVLKKRSIELAQSNQELKDQIKSRGLMEKELRTSERQQQQLLQDSARLQEQLRYLSHQILSWQEEERKQISRELHDQIATVLSGINLELDELKAAVTGNNEVLKRRISSTQQVIQRSVEIIHRFARELRPTTLDDLGLIPALHSLTKSLSKQAGIRITLTVFAAVEELEIEKRTVLYRVAQEALTNVVKHAAATEAKVSISKKDDNVLMIIRDDGRSFNVNRAFNQQKNGRLGMLGMRERVEMVGGQFSVESIRGSGTTIHASIPIKNLKSNGWPAGGVGR